MKKFPTDLLKIWFNENQRELPWREERTPYRVWISEIMLQQTQAVVVIPYFKKWMELFPTLESLAHAPIDTVLKCWEGLGYYSRARNIHSAAQFIVENHSGIFPSDEKNLLKIKGIGVYTQGAIRSFSFRQKVAAVDGNVFRVLSRFLATEEVIDLPSTQAALRKYADELLPEEHPWEVAEGLIELGALVCTKKPRCTDCPLKRDCLAYRHHLEHLLPKKLPPIQVTLLERTVGVITYMGNYLLKKGEKGKIMADLYEFPFIDGCLEGDIATPFSNMLQGTMRYVQALPIQKHSFTRYRATLYPHLLEAEAFVANGVWKKREELSSLPFSSGHKRILDALMLVNV